MQAAGVVGPGGWNELNRLGRARSRSDERRRGLGRSPNKKTGEAGADEWLEGRVARHDWMER